MPFVLLYGLALADRGGFKGLLRPIFKGVFVLLVYAGYTEIDGIVFGEGGRAVFIPEAKKEKEGVG